MIRIVSWIYLLIAIVLVPIALVIGIDLLLRLNPSDSTHEWGVFALLGPIGGVVGNTLTIVMAAAVPLVPAYLAYIGFKRNSNLGIPLIAFYAPLIPCLLIAATIALFLVLGVKLA